MSPSSKSSGCPVIVTVCGVAQSIGVNVTDGGTVPSDGSSDVSVIRTSAVGCDPSSIENSAVPPDSVVCSPVVGVSETPRPSSSKLTTLTSVGSSPL